MPLGRILHGRTEAAALARDHVQDHAALLVLGHGQSRLQRLEIVTIDRTEIAQPHLLEIAEPDQHTLEEALHAVNRPNQERQTQDAADALDRRLEAVVTRARDESAEVKRKRPRRLRDGHLIVVEDDDHLRTRRRAVVERLKARAVRNGGVSDDRNHVLLRPLQIARRGITFRHGQRHARMTGHGGIRLGLGGIGKTGDAAQLA